MVITMIPSLAAYDPQTFAEHFLHKSMGHLLSQLDKPPERSYGAESELQSSGAYKSTAFIAIGHTAAAMGSDMKPFLEPIMTQIKHGLQGRG
jgi:FKBP12-rapamycin complex-associated protein